MEIMEILADRLEKLSDQLDRLHGSVHEMSVSLERHLASHESSQRRNAYILKLLGVAIPAAGLAWSIWG